MPLLDHFHPPLSRSHPWRSFHGAWAAALARLLNSGVLPAGYYAAPFLDQEGPVEIDVGTLQERGTAAQHEGAGSAPEWAPPGPQLTVAVEWPKIEDVRVEVHTDDGDPRLAAAVEFVSPRNKDRPRAREAFANKCADYLRRGCGLVVVDVVTTRRADLRRDLLETLGVEQQHAGPEALSATSYRAVGGEDGRVIIWQAALDIGRPLPTLPLWISAETGVPLDLEASHRAACADLRIRDIG